MNHAEQLRALAHQIENQPQARDAIAQGFRLIADAVSEPSPCVDCVGKAPAIVASVISGQSQVIDHADNPATGV